MPDEPKTDAPSGTGDAGQPPEVPDDAPLGDDAPDDAASPAAILKRVSAFDEGDEVDRIARAEEEKLAARRKAERKPKKKSALESSQKKRLEKIGTKAQVRRSVAVAADADPLVDRAVDFGKWAKDNQQVVTGAVAAALLALVGTVGYFAYEKKHEADASVALAKALDDEHGRIGDPDKEEDDARMHDPTPIFKTIEDRRDAALGEYRAVESKYKGTGAAILARLAEGGLLLDKEDADGALAAYRDVSGSALAKADGEVRGRSLEGTGFAYELQAGAADGDKQKDLLGKAEQEYRALENTDVLGFKELGMYHQARVLSKEGKDPEAIELLKKLHERLASGDTHAFVYLEPVADDTLRVLSPDALPPKQAPGLGGLGGLGGKGANKLTPEQIERLYRQLQQSGGGKGAPLPGAGH